MSWPTPNKHGVFEDYEVLEHTTASGGYVEIGLVETADGWRHSVSVSWAYGYSGYAPSVRRPAAPTRQEAIDLAIDELAKTLRRTDTGTLISQTEQRQREEVRQWIEAMKQRELFAL